MVYYKYASEAGIKWMLEEQTVSFTSVMHLNDPFETGMDLTAVINEQKAQRDQQLRRAFSVLHGKAPTDYEFGAIKSAMKKQGITDEGLDTILNAMAWRVNLDKYREFGVYCLAESPVNLLMWSHYADSCAGLVLGFDTTVAPFSDSSYGGIAGLKKVIYSDTRANTVADTISERIRAICLTKSTVWEYEQEFRCIRRVMDAKEREIVGFDPAAIKEIIVGPKMKSENVFSIYDLHEKFYPHADFSIATLNPSSFAIDIRPMPPRKLYETFISDDYNVSPLDSARLSAP